jgi:hypothetical protein
MIIKKRVRMVTKLLNLQLQEFQQARRLIKKLMLFMAPLFFVFIVNFIVDPFNINRKVSLGFTKQEIACHYNERLWKLNSFLNNPQKNIILGDSRANRLSEKTLQTITGKSFSNLSLSGATLVEIIDTFWFAVTHADLKEVFVCINFDRFNDWQKASGVAQAVNTIQNPLLNYIQPETCKAVFHLLLQIFSNKKLINQQPPMDKQAFWQFQLDEIDTGYRRYVYPSYASKQLALIADHCNKNGIHLTFITFPTHTDLQKRIDTAQLRNQEQVFKQFLQSIGALWDFDITNDFTNNPLNFDDPKHVCFEAMDKLIADYLNYKKC